MTDNELIEALRGLNTDGWYLTDVAVVRAAADRIEALTAGLDNCAAEGGCRYGMAELRKTP